MMSKVLDVQYEAIDPKHNIKYEALCADECSHLHGVKVLREKTRQTFSPLGKLVYQVRYRCDYHTN